MTRYWSCNCDLGISKHPRLTQKCPDCGQRRPAARTTKHRAILDLPYEQWVDLFGERCGICDREPTPTRRLDRDHDHRLGTARGLLCVRCNRALPNWVDVQWLRAAAEYLERANTREAA